MKKRPVIELPDCTLTRSIRSWIVKRPLAEECDQDSVEAFEALNIAEIAITHARRYFARLDDRISLSRGAKKR